MSTTPLQASGCPGCRMPILFEPAELTADDEATADVMCAFCGGVTSRERLAATAYRHEPAARPVRAGVRARG